MKILVAGGAGFIGSNLIDALLAEGHDIVCVDNFFIGTRENIAHLHGHPRFTFYEEDLTDLETLKGIFEKENFDYVCHMAANSDIQASAQNPSVEYKNTYSTTFCILECMRLYGVKRLFFCSTSAVYGDAQGEEVHENFAPLMPISYYGSCKLGSEALISAFSAAFPDLPFPQRDRPPAHPRRDLRLHPEAPQGSHQADHPGRRSSVQAIPACERPGGVHHALQG